MAQILLKYYGLHCTLQTAAIDSDGDYSLKNLVKIFGLSGNLLG